MVERELESVDGTHPGADDLARYVMGALTDALISRVDEHVMQCEACAAALAREARLELSLAEVAAVATPVPRAVSPVIPAVELRSRRERVARVASVGFAGLAAAAVAIFALTAGHASTHHDASSDGTAASDEARGARPTGTEFCPDAADGRPCGSLAQVTGDDAAVVMQ